MRSLFPLGLILHVSLSCFAQQPAIQKSENGWYLSPHGSIRILVLFAEIDYDVNPAKDPQPEGARHWPKGSLPEWKDDLFDPRILLVPKARISRYYHDASLGRYAMIGDYVDRLLTLRESEYPNLGNAHGINALVVKEANKLGALRTRHGLGIADFDQWKRGGRPGLDKERGADDPHSYDHVMVILRNSSLTHGQGSVDSGSPGKLYGYESDTQSRFGGMNALPFEILQHEFNHMFFGGNNFHSGGGNAASFQSYFISLQGGWSMMGGANSSLLTCSAWDRVRLGWEPQGAAFRIRASDAGGREVNADLDPMQGDTGVYVLRDMITTGDALRIRIPFIPEDRYQQWLWIENHQGFHRNGSPSDRFHWEEAGSCIDPVPPGLFMTMQVDRESREGANIYGGYADYLRPVPANGRFDLAPLEDEYPNSCPFGSPSPMYRLDPRAANPLTGNHEQELPVYDRNGDGKVSRTEAFMTGARSEPKGITGQAVFFGRPEHAFRMDGKRKIGMGTNPSSTNMLTLASTPSRSLHGGKAPDVRTIYLNGISVELLNEGTGGELTIRVRANDTRIEEDMRWCADSIVLPPLRGAQEASLLLAKGRTLHLDRSATPTRLDQPEQAHGQVWFSSPTVLTVRSGALVLLEPKSRLILSKGSQIHLLPGSRLVFMRKAQASIEKGSRVLVHPDARIEADPRMIRKLEKRGAIEYL